MLLLVSARRRASAIRVHRRSCSSSAKKSPEIRLVCKSQRQRSLEGRGRLYGMKWVVDGYPFEGRETVTPLREDFDVVVRASGVDVTFKPTQSEYSFSRLVNAEDIERYGPISDVPRHAATGNTGRYDTAEVAQMAFDLASSAAKAAWR